MAEKTIPLCGVFLSSFPKQTQSDKQEVCTKCGVYEAMQTLNGRKETSVLRELVEKEMGETTDSEILSVVPEATQKLIWIIDREGTANGKRLTAEYYAKLIAERIIAERFIEKRKKEAYRKSGHASNHIYYSITIPQKNQ